MTTEYLADVAIAGGGSAGPATAYQLLHQGLRAPVPDRDTEDQLGGLAIRLYPRSDCFSGTRCCRD